jgi:hypothetical protein
MISLPSKVFMLGKSADFMNNSRTWIIHESRLLQMRGVVHEAVVYHREWATTKQVQ